MKTQSSVNYVRILVLFSILSTWIIVFFLSDDKIISLTKEGGIVETFGAIFLLV